MSAQKNGHHSLSSLAETAALAARVAALARPGDIFGLSGDLGVGKTTFARAFIHTRLGIDEVPSPTFSLAQVYGDDEIWHFDFYRLAAPDDAYELGIEHAFADAITLMEWPENLGDALPEAWLDIRFDFAPGTDARTISFVPHGPRAETLAAQLEQADG
jgi:tRNA threonylcarbamoyladenosine biosynthesis protein TsaE